MVNQHHLLLDNFPGGQNGFDLVSRFCKSNGRIKISVSNVCLLHCCSIHLGMKNLLKQTEMVLENMVYWSWDDLITCLKSCDTFVDYADSYGVVEQLVSCLHIHLKLSFKSSHTTTPETGVSSSSDSFNNNNINRWWFDDLVELCPNIINKIINFSTNLGFKSNNITLTKFLLHYIKTTKTKTKTKTSEYSKIADKAVELVLSIDESPPFSCRKLLGILRLVSGFGVSKGRRDCLEKRIGEMLDQATLDDLMVIADNKGDCSKGVYDVNLVLRLVRIFVMRNYQMMRNLERVKKVGRLIDKYLGEIAPDQNLRVSKFVCVAESVPDFGRDCFDGVYRAIDIYLLSHPRLPSEERSKLCKCLNYKKMSLEACKDLAKNPKIPPKVTIEALMSQPCNQNINSSKKRVVELRKECSTGDVIRTPQMLHLFHASPTTLFSNSFC